MLRAADSRQVRMPWEQPERVAASPTEPCARKRSHRNRAVLCGPPRPCVDCGVLVERAKRNGYAVGRWRQRCPTCQECYAPKHAAAYRKGTSAKHSEECAVARAAEPDPMCELCQSVPVLRRSKFGSHPQYCTACQEFLRGPKIQVGPPRPCKGCGTPLEQTPGHRWRMWCPECRLRHMLERRRRKSREGERRRRLAATALRGGKRTGTVIACCDCGVEMVAKSETHKRCLDCFCKNRNRNKKKYERERGLRDPEWLKGIRRRRNRRRSDNTTAAMNLARSRALGPRGDEEALVGRGEKLLTQRKTGNRRRRLGGVYALLRGQFDARVVQQGGRCALCGDSEQDRERRGLAAWLVHLHVDHLHRDPEPEPRLLRAFLCQQCNIGLGALRDSATLLGGDSPIGIYLRFWREFYPEGCDPWERRDVWLTETGPLFDREGRRVDAEATPRLALVR